MRHLMTISAFIIFSMISPLFVSAQNPDFITVDGPSLTTRMETAVRLGQAKLPPSRFWTAYSFDVRPGVAVDLQMINTDGTTSNYGVMIGGGFETRNLGVFLLREPDGKTIIRIEVFNMDRRREYSGYPVYWMNHAETRENVSLLSSFLSGNPPGSLAERAIMVLSLHDEPGVVSVLRNIARTSPTVRVRTAAISWLGHLDSDPAFFAGMVRDENEILDIRRRAVFALAARRDRAAYELLMTLYGAITDRELKKRLLSAVAGSDYDESSNEFLMSVARNTGEEQEIRRQAIREMERHGDERIIPALIRLYNEENNEEIQVEIINFLGQMDHIQSTEKLIEVARGQTSKKLRQRAAYWLGKSSDPKAALFFETMLRE